MNDADVDQTLPSDAPGPARRRNPLALAAIAVVVTAIGAMWVYAFFFASKQSPDQLPDTAWAERSEQICGVWRQQIDALPPAGSFLKVEPRSEALRQRADVGDQANDLLGSMINELHTVPVADGYTRKGADLWLGDWDRYLQARRDHVAEWRQGIDRPFAEPPAQEGKFTPVSLRMDAFAMINRMPSCEVPQDFG